MHGRLLAAAVVASLLAAAPAARAQGDPIMPLSQVHAGMRCTGYSVFHGTDVGSFAVTVLDVVAGDPSEDGPRILVQVSGPAVDATGIGPGFSGSPIYCAGRNIGAISESVGEYGGKVALATPIEAILGTPVDPPPPRTRTLSARERVWLASGRPLASPLTVSGLSAPLAHALSAAARRRGRTVLAAPAGPLGSFPPPPLRPGASVGVGYSSGDLRLGAIGTVAYVDRDRVWAFGHPLDGVGGRALLLQDAYVFHIVNNPNVSSDETTYKLASLGHDRGTLTDDANDAVAGRLGALPHAVPVHVLARDADTGARKTVDVKVADEYAMDLPLGTSPLTPIAPLAVGQALSELLGSTPARLTATMCARIQLQELARPLRFCDRYVSDSLDIGDDGGLTDAVGSRAAGDVMTALGDVETYTGRPPHVTAVSVELTVARGARQAFLRSVRLPRRVRPGQTVRVRATLQVARGGIVRRAYRMRLPAGLRRGVQPLILTGVDVDSTDAALLADIVAAVSGADFGESGPRSLNALAAQVRRIARYDGVTLHVGPRHVHAFRDPALRISGVAHAVVRVVSRARTGRRSRAG
jgi:hypothetical protein